ncbi:unnamed protein product [Mucor hiemalis]
MCILCVISLSFFLSLKMVSLSIIHNPRCSKSRNALAYLEDNKDKYNYDVQVILYQKEPLTREQLEKLSNYLGLTAKDDKTQPWKILLRPDAQKLVSSWEETYELLEEDLNILNVPLLLILKMAKLH